MRPLRRLLAAGVVALAAAAPLQARAQLLTFDDVAIDASGYRGNLPSPYHGFTFASEGSDLGVILSTASIIAPGTGYQFGVVSPSNVFYSLFGARITSATPFTFDDGYFASAFRSGATVTASGWLGGVQQFSTSFTVDMTGPTFRSFGWSNIDQVRILISGGTGQGTSYLVADNLRFNGATTSVVPEPTTVTLMGLGLTGMAVVARRRKRGA